jgi:hypothetical protein
MEDDTKQLIKQRLAELPEGMRNAVTSSELPIKLQSMMQKFNLRIDQASALETEVMLVMLGFEPTDDFVTNIKKELGIDDATAGAIAMEANEKLFMPIRQAMREAEHDVASVPPTGTPPVNLPGAMPAAIPKKDIFGGKFEQQTKMTHEEHDLSAPVAPAPKPTPTPSAPDPYREPVQ